ncbi:hypothetical protein QE152_g3820 [Popillia japonica]|uniref:Uncharacterized protein n=1 Tax=Popillia japonica TaxID=7064 RepID=A0AAW1N339_POPJA
MSELLNSTRLCFQKWKKTFLIYIPPIRFYGRKAFHTLPEAADEIENYEGEIDGILVPPEQIFLQMKKNRMMTTLWKVKFQMMCRVLWRSVLEIRSNGVTVMMNPKFRQQAPWY